MELRHFQCHGGLCPQKAGYWGAVWEAEKDAATVLAADNCIQVTIPVSSLPSERKTGKLQDMGPGGLKERFR